MATKRLSHSSVLAGIFWTLVICTIGFSSARWRAQLSGEGNGDVTVVSGSGAVSDDGSDPMETETGALRTGSGTVDVGTGTSITESGSVLTASGTITIDTDSTTGTGTVRSETETGTVETSSGTSPTTVIVPPTDEPKEETTAQSSASSSEERTETDVLTPIQVSLLTDAPHAQSNPEVLIARNSRIQNLADIEGSLVVSLSGSGKDLPISFDVYTDDRHPEAAAIVRIITPSTFVPGTYRLRVLWNTSREELRLLRRLLDTFTGGMQELLLEQDIVLGTTVENGNGTSTSDLLTISRTGATTTSLLKVETMTITVTPHRSFIGTVTEHVPAGFTVQKAEPLSTMESTPEGTTITWNRKWDAESPVTMQYTFKTPLTSPLFAQFGPVEVRGTAVGGKAEEPEEGKELKALQESEDAKESNVSSSDSSTQQSSESDVGSVSSTPEVLEIKESNDHPAIQSSFDSFHSSASSDSSASSSSLAASSQQETSSAPSDTPESSQPLSFLSRFLGSLISAQITSVPDVSFSEPYRYELLSLPIDQGQDLPAGTLTLTPKGGNVFDANALPSFTLTTEAVTGTTADILDADGNLKDEKALGKVISVLTSGTDVKQEIMQAILEEKKTEIADALSQDSVTVSTIAGGDRRPQSATKTKIEDTLTDPRGQAEVADALKDNAALSTILDAVVTKDVKDAVAENAVKEAMGETPKSFLPFLTPTPPSAAEAAAGSANITTGDLMQNVVDAVSGDKEARKEVANAVATANDQSSISNHPNVPSDSSDSSDSSVSSLIKVKLTDKSGRTFSPNFHFVPGSVVLVLEPMREFVPGLYTLEVQIMNPLTGESTTKTQDFAWGVLAMNTDQDRYVQGDTVHASFGVLDDLGQIVCDAELRLVVKAPSGEKKEYESTRVREYGSTGIREYESTGIREYESTGVRGTSDTDTIHTTDTCGQKDSMMISPDYEVSFPVTESGTYTVYLEATTKNGVRGMTHRFTVNNAESQQPNAANPFIISRQAATRLYPAGNSPMTITVQFHQDFTGTVTETVPESFAVSNINNKGVMLRSEASRSTDTATAVLRDASMEAPQGDSGLAENKIKWSGSWKSGTTATFSYLYDAPDQSPDFFLIGPLRLSSAVPFTHQ